MPANFRGPSSAGAGETPLVCPSRWEFSVRDNGLGIRPDARERVFRLFERLGSAGTGTGVGLALSRRAVEKLGGRIWVGSHDGPGTTFLFTIPHPLEATADVR